MRFFGLILAVVAMAQSANAALLSTWNFDSNADAVVSAGVAGTGTAFTNVGTAGSNGINGAISSQRWATATNVTNTSAAAGDSKYNTFSFTNTGSNPYVLTDMAFDLGRVGGSGTNVIRVLVTQQIGTGSEDEVFSVTANSGTLSSKGDSLVNTLLSPGETVTYRFYYSRSGSTSGGLIDNIMLNGELVPEPASMAIFGLLGVGAAARRFRRKK
ncbi:MAG: PEP-CTERM sorting domain-containing protein [Pirellula sp.]|nr:PEP-CTERM sorting domain-containing protein [Pirellula sp.]